MFQLNEIFHLYRWRSKQTLWRIGLDTHISSTRIGKFERGLQRIKTFSFDEMAKLLSSVGLEVKFEVRDNTGKIVYSYDSATEAAARLTRNLPR